MKIKYFREFLLEHTIQEPEELAKNVTKHRIEMGGTEDPVLWLGDLIASKRKNYVEIWDIDDYRYNQGDPLYIFERRELEQMKEVYHSGESVLMLKGLRVVINRKLNVFDCFYDEMDMGKYFFFGEDTVDQLIDLLDSSVNEKFKTPALPKNELFKKSDKAKGVTLRKDKNGYYVHTHRARSKSYKEVSHIPKRAIEFIESTG